MSQKAYDMPERVASLQKERPTLRTQMVQLSSECQSFYVQTALLLEENAVLQTHTL